MSRISTGNPWVDELLPEPSKARCPWCGCIKYHAEECEDNEKRITAERNRLLREQHLQD